MFASKVKDGCVWERREGWGRERVARMGVKEWWRQRQRVGNKETELERQRQIDRDRVLKTIRQTDRERERDSETKVTER